MLKIAILLPPMHIFITVKIQPVPLLSPPSIMHSSAEPETCQVLHGLQHRASAPGVIVVDEEDEAQTEDNTVFSSCSVGCSMK